MPIRDMGWCKIEHHIIYYFVIYHFFIHFVHTICFAVWVILSSKHSTNAGFKKSHGFVCRKVFLLRHSTSVVLGNKWYLFGILGFHNHIAFILRCKITAF